MRSVGRPTLQKSHFEQQEIEETAQREFLKQLQRFTASAMITASAVRKVGAPGAVERARTFCAELSLRGLRRMASPEYASWLDARTEQLRSSLPEGAQKWGSARKAINIFMRSATYTVPLAAEYRLERILPLLEVPLDSHVARGLHNTPEGSELPAWKSIVSLTEERNRAYQAVASLVARRMRIHRADLDVFYWRA